MGSIFGSPKTVVAPPPPPTTVRDEVNGVEQVPVTNPDGSVTYITRTIPLTAEQQAQKEELEKIMQESLAEIQKLSAADYGDDDQTRRVLDQWQGVQTDLLGKQAAVRERNEEQELARRGLSDSSAAQEVRRQRQLDAQDAEKVLNLQREEMGNQVRGEKLALQQNLYNIAASATDSASARVQQAAFRTQGEASALNAQRQASLLDYYRAQNGGGAGFGSALGTGLGGALGRSVGGGLGGTIGGAAGFAVGGPVGSAAGSMLGSWLFGGR